MLLLPLCPFPDLVCHPHGAGGGNAPDPLGPLWPHTVKEMGRGQKENLGFSLPKPHLTEAPWPIFYSSRAPGSHHLAGFFSTTITVSQHSG